MKTARTALFEFIIEQAKAIHNTKAQPKAEPSMPDPRQAALQALFDSDTSREGVFGCYTEKVAKLVAVMTGLKVAVKKAGRGDVLAKFTVAMVISKNGMNHQHEINKPVICLHNEGHCYNGINIRNDIVVVPDTRKPTDEEFNAFIASLNEEALFRYTNSQIGLDAMLQ